MRRCASAARRLSSERRPVALVTGGGQRLGAAMSRALASRGYDVAVHCRASCMEADALVTELGGGARRFVADLAEAEAPARLVAAVMAAYGRLDLLVNNAASFERTPFDTLTVEQWDRVFAVNLRAPFFLAVAAARVMGAGASIVNLSDLAGFETWPAYIPHGLAKSGVASMTRALASQLAPRVRVNAIAPGVVLPPVDMDLAEVDRLATSTPLGRHGTPGDVVQAVEYFLDATFVTGQVLFIDGGRHIRR
ncbi:MAG: SDR family oxidoreductase [Gemmatimonadetes bacterium]|nr:SDR family oxidoreductase [Gemmatimonadota bacterium]